MKNFLGKYYKFVVFLFFLVIVVLGMRLIRTNKVRTGEVLDKEKATTSIEGLTPGISIESDLDIFGEPRSVEELADGTTLYKFGPEKSPRPIEVVVEKGKIIFMKKYPAVNDKDTLDYYLKTFGEFDLSLFYEEPEFIAYVFLDEGLVVVAHQGERGNVYELRYFVPVSEEKFLETWGEDLLTKPPSLPPLYY